MDIWEAEIGPDARREDAGVPPGVRQGRATTQMAQYRLPPKGLDYFERTRRCAFAYVLYEYAALGAPSLRPKLSQPNVHFIASQTLEDKNKKSRCR